jgi:hypothetical protein
MADWLSWSNPASQSGCEKEELSRMVLFWPKSGVDFSRMSFLEERNGIETTIIYMIFSLEDIYKAF